jgi:LmbE family N-acetylglucosaminyl deacetylase
MMLRFKLDLPQDGTVLCLGTYCDDIEIGCAGTLIELREGHPQLRFVWAVFSGMSSAKRAQVQQHCRASARISQWRSIIFAVDPIDRFRLRYAF